MRWLPYSEALVDAARPLAHLLEEFQHNASVVRMVRRSAREEYGDYLAYARALRDCAKLILADLARISEFVHSETVRREKRRSDLRRRTQRPVVNVDVDWRDPSEPRLGPAADQV
jgi:hypothetical protein